MIKYLVAFLCVLSSFSRSYAEPPSSKEQSNPPPFEDVKHSNPPPFEDVNLNTGSEDHFLRDMLQMMLTLGLIVAMIFFITWLLKKVLSSRIQQLNATSDIKILDRRSLSPKSVIYILEARGRGIIVAESTNGLTHLSDFSSDTVKGKSSFNDLMQEKR
jgi:flagellar biogenesis protein FliO